MRASLDHSELTHYSYGRADPRSTGLSAFHRSHLHEHRKERVWPCNGLKQADELVLVCRRCPIEDVLLTKDKNEGAMYRRP